MKLYDYKAEELQKQIYFLKILMIAPLAITFIFSIIIYLIKFIWHVYFQRKNFTNYLNNIFYICNFLNLLFF